MKSQELHRFFCIRCGHEGIPLFRKAGHQHQAMHRKKLYCPYCKLTINHIECRTEDEVYDFKLAFAAGEYKQEVENELNEIHVPSGLLE